MKLQKNIILVILSIFALANPAISAIVTIQVEGVGTFHVKDDKGTYEWNGKIDDDCRCWSGNETDCWFESVSSNGPVITIDDNNPHAVVFSGTLNPVSVTIENESGQPIQLESKSDVFTVPDSYYIVPEDGLIPGLSAGTIIDFPEFTTNANSEYEVQGTVRQ